MKIIAPKPFYFDNGPKAVVLLHSLSGTPNDMRLLGRFLERNGYSAYAPMFAGHGTREPLDIIEKGGPANWWKQAEEALDFLKSQGKTEIYFFGLSLGAIFATKAIENMSDVLGGGTFGSPLFNTSFKMIRSEFLIYAQKVYQLNELADSEIDSKLAVIDSKIDGFLTNIQTETLQVTEDLKKIHKPYFIGQGKTDKMVDPHGADKVQSIVTDADLHWYDAGHVLTINNAHKDLQSDVLNFLEKIEERNA
ncbi:alpha/beta hydrolase [Companilactobacillus sp.]|jgi:carboxylesterase|uniref:alpha/beta hydrolase n=1 Tax=Companilactobacillus sp. TaxID=2767905 RepID=UPI0025BA315A|nr:alpha/beta hydrolase [Companilactobacillus sp.]MCH4008763.1 alpha/beta hydrolase [Companilactobacillus sp.]MCH4051058.1 alpha/beta hydrolase [Companilactobacillus sp.]MCH4076706.1 alpha/beta hydrolase [Companilactobacillus sp.]MCH4125281.1 alpha/beta hydrolase [Companilactobacillus sp.]MCH4131821.1 alpha/beta hydrolase [Companilactobacillus sp.]